ncbi:MAG: universal stress protein, partial [Bacteroidota bacterium]|nr:universal stress protein [Bacteroidota bacterium]
MKERLITVAILPLYKAQVLKSRLESEGIECFLQDVTLIEGAPASGIKVSIMEADMKKALSIAEELFGKEKREAIKADEPPVEASILVPIDFSEYSLTASRLAVDLACHLDAKVVFMHSFMTPFTYAVHYSDHFMYDTNFVKTLHTIEENTQQDFESFIASVKKEVGKVLWKKARPEYMIKTGEAEEDIISYAKEHRPMLIVMGTRGAGNRYGDLIGSVTAEVITRVKVPVLAVPKDSAVKTLDQVHNVLYATKFDSKDLLSIDRLLSLLSPFDVKLFCAHFAPQPHDFWDEAKLEGLKEMLHKKYSERNFEVAFIEGEDFLISIESFIRDNQIDIISLTTHKKNIIARMFNPGIARKMLFHTN